MKNGVPIKAGVAKSAKKTQSKPHAREVAVKRKRRRKRTAHARDLALAILGASNATDVVLRQVIARHIAVVLDAADGNLSLTADLLGMHRRSLRSTDQVS